MIMISNVFFNFINVCVIVSFFFFTKLLTLGIFFFKSIKSVLVAKLVILGILSLTSFILVLRVVLVAKLAISGILSSIFFMLALYISFLATSFSTASLSLLEWTGTGTNLSTGTSFSLSISNLSALDFKLGNVFYRSNY